MKKTFGNLSNSFLSRNQMKMITGGKAADITCTITDQSTGQVMSSGGCASSNMNNCVGYTARDASSLAVSTGHSMDFECHPS
jgi:hypothetical protein